MGDLNKKRKDSSPKSLSMQMSRMRLSTSPLTTPPSSKRPRPRTQEDFRALNHELNDYVLYKHKRIPVWESDYGGNYDKLFAFWEKHKEDFEQIVNMEGGNGVNEVISNIRYFLTRILLDFNTNILHLLFQNGLKLSRFDYDQFYAELDILSEMDNITPEEKEKLQDMMDILETYKDGPPPKNPGFKKARLGGKSGRRKTRRNRYKKLIKLSRRTHKQN